MELGYSRSRRRRHIRASARKRRSFGPPIALVFMGGICIALCILFVSILSVYLEMPIAHNPYPHQAGGSRGAAPGHRTRSSDWSLGNQAHDEDHVQEAGREVPIQPVDAPEAFMVGVDFIHGDLKGVGPLNVRNQEECRELCIKDGRCLMWTLQLESEICWLKGGSGRREDNAERLVSGMVRAEADLSIETPKYGGRKSNGASHEPPPPPPPVECCPEAASRAPPGVHRFDLWDDQPGSDWTTSYMLGNGHLGAILGMGIAQETMYMSDASLWAGKGKLHGSSRFMQSPDRFKEFREAREALLKGDIITGNDAAGRMPTSPQGFVSSFEYAGELALDFMQPVSDRGLLDVTSEQQRAGHRIHEEVEGYLRHLHLNNATAEVSFVSLDPDMRRSHSREAFASHVDGVLAIRLRCIEDGNGEGCLSFQLTPGRGGESYSTEAWKLPHPVGNSRFREAGETGGIAEEESGLGAAAYTGIFRAPDSQPGAEMAFHMCAAVIPTSPPNDERKPAVGTETRSLGEVVSQEWEEPVPDVSLSRRKGKSKISEVRRGDSVISASQEPSKDGKGKRRDLARKRHRVALVGDEEGHHEAEALVLVAIVTEGGQGDGHENHEKHERDLDGGDGHPSDGHGRLQGSRLMRQSLVWKHSRMLQSRMDDVEEFHPASAARGTGTGTGTGGDGHTRSGSFGEGAKRHEASSSYVDNGGVTSGDSNGESILTDDGERLSSRRRLELQSRAANFESGAEDNVDGRWRSTAKEHVGEGDANYLRGECLTRLESAAGLGFDTLRARHMEDVEALFSSVDFSLETSAEVEDKHGDYGMSCKAGLPIRTRVDRSGKTCTQQESGPAGEEVATSVEDDELIELMYHFGRYLLISGSRAGGRPLNLQGLWANSLKAKWEGDYHLNINLQMAYWAAQTAGLSDCAEPLAKFVEDLSDSGRQTAESYYRAPGWVAHANSDRWGGTAAHGDASWALCPTCGAWLALHLWEAYEFTRDPDFLLASVLPAFEGAVIFFLDYMVLADDGKGDGTCLLTGPSTSPENSLPALANSETLGSEAATEEAARASDEILESEKLDAAEKGRLLTQVSLETSEKAKRRAKSSPPEFIFPFVAMSPAIDVAIVRQLLTNYVDAAREAQSLLMREVQEGGADHSSWARANAPRLFSSADFWRSSDSGIDSKPAAGDGRTSESLTSEDVCERLMELSRRASAQLEHLPNQGRPVVGKDGLIREYRGIDASDLPDPGHRHWSGLWALYPGFQILADEDPAEFVAAAATVQHKMDNGGGHTAWSRTWLANLRARLFQGDKALVSLRGVVRDQSIGSLYTLHPPLQPSKKGHMGCQTCYEAISPNAPARKRGGKSKEGQSGLVTASGAAFQIDGNMGLVAAVNEMLLQSRYLQYPTGGSQGTEQALVQVRLLPALPQAWTTGRFRGLRVRGGFEVDVAWEKGAIVAVSLRLASNKRSRPLHDKSTRCRVMSRTRLKVDGDTELTSRKLGGLRADQQLHDRGNGVESVLEGGVLWHVLEVGPIRPGHEVKLVSHDSP